MEKKNVRVVDILLDLEKAFNLGRLEQLAGFWVDFLMEELQQNTIRIIDLDEVAFNDLKAFVKGYLPKRIIGMDGALYYYVRDPVPPCRSLPISEKFFGPLFGKLSVLVTSQKKSPEGLLPFTQQREVDRFERILLYFGGMGDKNCFLAHILVFLDTLLKRGYPFSLSSRTKRILELFMTEFDCHVQLREALFTTMGKIHFESDS